MPRSSPDERDLMKNPLLAILVFAGVFLCGGVVGGAVSIRYYEQFVRNKGADRFFDREMRDLGEKLALTPQQRKEIHTIFRRAMADQRAARKQADGIIDRMVAEFEKVLTPEQLAQFKEHRARQRAAREKLMREREQERERRGVAPAPEGGRPSPFFLERRERERSLNAPPRAEDPAPPRASDAGEKGAPSP
jgi:hypothetical protein